MFSKFEKMDTYTFQSSCIKALSIAKDTINIRFYELKESDLEEYDNFALDFSYMKDILDEEWMNIGKHSESISKQEKEKPSRQFGEINKYIERAIKL